MITTTHRIAPALRALRVLSISLFLLAGLMQPAASQTVSTLYTFSPGQNGGQFLSSPLLKASDGSLFGETSNGGIGSGVGFGTVIQFTPPAVDGGAWTETVIYSFLGGVDGLTPAGGLVADKAGNLYGTTAQGGTVGSCNCGTVFKLKPPATPGGIWTKRILHTFTRMNGDGGYTFGAGVVVDSKGIVYGTTGNGGTYDSGTVFRIQPQGSGFAVSEIYSFGGTPVDGGFPTTSVTLDAAGNLYGATSLGGLNGQGTVYELSPPASGGVWKETVLYNFQTYFDTSASSALIMDKSGQLYGTRFTDGANNLGTVYRLTPPTAGQTEWSRTNLWTFQGNGDGGIPGGLAIDRATGIFYGMAQYANFFGGCGVAYQLAPPAVAGGAWQYAVLDHLINFTGCGTSQPLFRDSAGHLYGFTGNTVYEITP